LLLLAGARSSGTHAVCLVVPLLLLLLCVAAHLGYPLGTFLTLQPAAAAAAAAAAVTTTGTPLLNSRVYHMELIGFIHNRLRMYRLNVTTCGSIPDI
jgi:hypothetical protein